jgi:hypothetical protein
MLAGQLIAAAASGSRRGVALTISGGVIAGIAPKFGTH